MFVYVAVEVCHYDQIHFPVTFLSVALIHLVRVKEPFSRQDTQYRVA